MKYGLQNRYMYGKRMRLKMVQTEGELRRLSGLQTQGVFEYCFVSPNFVLVSTKQCPDDLLSAIIQRFNPDQQDCLTPIRTYTSRELFTTTVSLGNDSSKTIVLKKSRYEPRPAVPSLFDPGTVKNEITTNTILTNIIKQLNSSVDLKVPKGFDSLSVRVETPLGILIDREKRLKYSLFVFENDVYTGEALQFTDPPIQGAITYTQRAWKLFCAIKDVLDTIASAAAKRGLEMKDYDIHQVLYRARRDERSLEIILIDSERLRIKIAGKE